MRQRKILNTKFLAFRAQNDKNGSISAFRRCLEIDDQFSEAHSTLAMLLSENGNAEKAGTHLQKSHRIESV